MKKKIIIIVSLCLVILFLLVLDIVTLIPKNTGKFNNTTTELNNNSKNSSSTSNDKYSYNKFNVDKIKNVTSGNELSNNIELKKIFIDKYESNNKYAHVYVYGINNNSSTIELNIKLNYYDSNNKRIEVESSGTFEVLGNSLFVKEITILDDSNDYSKVTLEFVARKEYSYTNEVSKDLLSFNYTEDNDSTLGKSISGTFTNNSQLELSNVNMACLFYKNNEVIYALPISLFNIKPGNSDDFNIYSFQLQLGLESSDGYIDYDKYDISIFSAYEYNNEFE